MRAETPDRRLGVTLSVVQPLPIVVASIQGTEQIHKNWYRRRSDVQFRIIETIPTEFVSANRTSAIGERVHNELSAALKET